MSGWNEFSFVMDGSDHVSGLSDEFHGRRRRSSLENTQHDRLSEDHQVSTSKEDRPILQEICATLEIKETQISREMEELRHAQKTCRNALEMIHREETAWLGKLEVLRKKLEVAEQKKKETDIMLKLHTTLAASKTLTGTVRNVQKLLADDVPQDVQVMVVDCLNDRNTASAKECIVCMGDFTAEDLLSVKTNERCRHTVNPCGHSAICGKCAKYIYHTTRKCPLCRAFMTKRPKIFRPGRQQ